MSLITFSVRRCSGIFPCFSLRSFQLTTPSSLERFCLQYTVFFFLLKNNCQFSAFLTHYFAVSFRWCRRDKFLWLGCTKLMCVYTLIRFVHTERRKEENEIKKNCSTIFFSVYFHFQITHKQNYWIILQISYSDMCSNYFAFMFCHAQLNAFEVVRKKYTTKMVNFISFSSQLQRRLCFQIKKTTTRKREQKGFSQR